MGLPAKSMRKDEASVTQNPSDIIMSGDGSTNSESTTGSLSYTDSEITTQNFTLASNNSSAESNINGGLIFGIILTVILLLAFIVLVYRRRMSMKKRQNDMFHVPIIEYKEDTAHVPTHSTAGYGTYRDLEEYPINDFSTRIEGKLTLQGLHSNI